MYFNYCLHFLFLGVNLDNISIQVLNFYQGVIIMKSIMWENIYTGLILLLLSIIIHAIATRFIVFIIKRKSKLTHKIYSIRTIWLSVYITLLLVASIFESLIWALTYLYKGTFSQLTDALYFSIVTFTTLGYGDIVLNEHWRLLASIQAAGGIIIFGWSTAIIVAVVQNYYFKK